MREVSERTARPAAIGSYVVVAELVRRGQEPVRSLRDLVVADPDASRRSPRGEDI